MEDIAKPPFYPAQVEYWIHSQFQEGKQESFIADELLKQWEKGNLHFQSKFNVARFCLRNFFYVPIIRMLRQDLRNGYPVAWAVVLEICIKLEISLSKDDIDAFLSGATRDHQLHILAAHALRLKEKDSRWPKILQAEQAERLSEAKKERAQIFEELEIFKREGMTPQWREAVEKILALFPDDPEAQVLAKKLDEQALVVSLENLRKNQDRRKRPRSLKEESEIWPELALVIEKKKSQFDHETAYHLSLGLHQMGLNQLALDLLRAHQTQWQLREKTFEIELLLALHFFAEALDICQKLLKEFLHDADVMISLLYLSAKAYHGLEDSEQAVNILKGLVQHRPDYRDASILLNEWEAEIS